MSCDDPSQPLLQSGKDLEVSCTAVDGAVELTLFKNRKTRSITKRIIRLNALECEQAEPDQVTQDPEQLSCYDCLKHPCGRRQIISPRLHKIRDKGNELIRSIVLPVLSRWNSKLRVLFLLVSVLLGFVSLVFAVVTAIRNPNNVFTPVRITVTVCTTALSLIHLIISCLQNQRKSDDGVESNAQNSRNTLCMKLCSLSTWELYCILLKEAFEYPVVACNIIEKAITQGFSTNKDKLLLGYFIFSVFKLAFEVYFVRFLVICYSIHSLRQLRQGSTFVNTESDSARNGDIDVTTDTEMTEVKYRRFTTHGLMLEVVFCCHVLVQMFSQIVLLAALWVKIQCENHFVQDRDVYISMYSWMLIVGGFFLPIIGTFAFYIPWNKHIQMYPIEFMMDMFSALRKCGVTSISQNARENLKRVHSSIIAAMTREKRSTKEIFLAILTTPTLAILSLLFLVPVVTALAGIGFGTVFEYDSENATVVCACDLTMSVTTYTLTLTNDTYSIDEETTYFYKWSGVSITALLVTIFSNGATLSISVPSLSYVVMGIVLIVLLPFLFIVSVLLYCVYKCVCPGDEDCTVFSCMLLCFAGLYERCDTMFLKSWNIN